MKVLLILALITLSWDCTQGKIFSRCELAKELYRHGFSLESLPTWVCIAEHESGLDCSRHRTSSSVSYFGLFGISDKRWCKCHKYGGFCKMHCRRFLRHNVYYSAKCAQIIYSIHGWNWWKVYGRYCSSSSSLPDLSGCNL